MNNKGNNMSIALTIARMIPDGTAGKAEVLAQLDVLIDKHWDNKAQLGRVFREVEKMLDTNRYMPEAIAKGHMTVVQERVSANTVHLTKLNSLLHIEESDQYGTGV
jgi:hypothetical protein